MQQECLYMVAKSSSQHTTKHTLPTRCDIGMLIHSEPMDQDQVFAMFQNANIGVQAACIFQMHFLACYGASFLASESKIWQPLPWPECAHTTESKTVAIQRAPVMISGTMMLTKS
jgi:hypothetical protein